jgi:hypothetical protein
MERSVLTGGLRWAFVPIAALLGFLASVFLAESIDLLVFHLLSPGGAMPSRLFEVCSWTFDGAVAASLVIQFGTYTAPHHKAIVAICLLVLGGIVAWRLVGEFYLPLHGPWNDATRTWWPLAGTYILVGPSLARGFGLSKIVPRIQSPKAELILRQAQDDGWLKSMSARQPPRRPLS